MTAFILTTAEPSTAAVATFAHGRITRCGRKLRCASTLRAERRRCLDIAANIAATLGTGSVGPLMLDRPTHAEQKVLPRVATVEGGCCRRRHELRIWTLEGFLEVHVAEDRGDETQAPVARRMCCLRVS